MDTLSGVAEPLDPAALDELSLVDIVGVVVG